MPTAPHRAASLANTPRHLLLSTRPGQHPHNHVPPSPRALVPMNPCPSTSPCPHEPLVPSRALAVAFRSLVRTISLEPRSAKVNHDVRLRCSVSRWASEMSADPAPDEMSCCESLTSDHTRKPELPPQTRLREIMPSDVCVMMSDSKSRRRQSELPHPAENTSVTIYPT